MPNSMCVNRVKSKHAHVVISKPGVTFPASPSNKKVDHIDAYYAGSATANPFDFNPKVDSLDAGQSGGVHLKGDKNRLASRRGETNVRDTTTGSLVIVLTDGTTYFVDPVTFVDDSDAPA
jgi:hypothetical protein